MAASNLQLELVVDARARVAEGPVWDGRAQQLIWVDVPVGRVHRSEPATGRDTFIDYDEAVGAVALRSVGGLVVALAGGVGITDTPDAHPQLVAPVATDHSSGRMNDGKCDPHGRFWAGTMNKQHPATCRLYRFDPDRSLHPMLEGVTVSNGLGWSPDASTMYYIDTPTLGVDAFDYDADTGTLGARRRLATIERGRPDGLTVDAEGNVWVALFAGGAVQCFAPDGRQLRTVDVPAERVTSCTFGGADLDVLFITTARGELTDAQLTATGQPHAGGIFACLPGVAGLPAAEFAG